MRPRAKIAVVGSGFSAWGALNVFAQREDLDVHVFDIGLTEGNEGTTETEVANAKKFEGSFFPYGINDTRFPVKLTSERMCSAHSLGGFSVVFSGALQYPKNSDLQDWPSGSQPTAADYSAILRVIPVLTERDELDSVFPIDPDSVDLDDSGEHVSAVGLSRIATTSTAFGQADVGRVFSLVEWFNRAIEDRKISYVGDAYVSQLEATANGVRLTYQKDRSAKTEEFNAVFLGAGCVNSTAIVDRSVYEHGSRDYEVFAPKGVLHAFFRFPGRLGSSLKFRQRSGFPMYFLEVRSDNTGNSWSHTQLTSLNRQILEMVGSFFPSVARPLINALKNIFYFAMSGERSGGQPIATIRSTIDPGRSHLARQNVEINEKEVQNSPRLVNAVRREVIKNWRVLRMVPIPFGAQLADFFRGNRLGGWHFGGTLPMRSVPEKLTECWGNGELNGIPRVFILDSSAFPSLPSSTIALLSAAHGHRVARTWCEHRSAEALP